VPVSQGLKSHLLLILEPVWSARVVLPELYHEIFNLLSIYGDDVMFYDVKARCAWEVTLEPDVP
jgi:hypothetical protein